MADRPRKLARLERLADRLEHQGHLEANAGHAERAKHGYELIDDARAVRWAMSKAEQAGASMEAAE